MRGRTRTRRGRLLFAGLTDAERRAMSARRLAGQHGLSGVVARFVLDLTRHAAEIPEAQSERVLAQVSDLAISLLATPEGPDYADARQRSALDRIKGYIAAHVRDPALAPDEIAAAGRIRGGERAPGGTRAGPRPARRRWACGRAGSPPDGRAR
jgi:hypothetical protein